MPFARLGRTWRKGPALAIGILAAAGLLFFMFASNVVRMGATTIDWPGSCDDFGYLRQARLFQDKGWIGGLDTRIADPQSHYLVDKVRALGAPVGMWGHGVAPHCHHYKERTQRIILQYPPGTGFVLSFFPAGTQARWAFVLYNFLVLAILLAVGAAARTLMRPLLIVVLGAFCFHGMYFFRLSMSTLPSTLAALAAAWLTVAATTRTGGKRIGFLALLGLVIGLATSFRLPNLFWVVGPIAVLGALFLRRPSLPAFAALAWLSLGVLAGLPPLIAAQAINAGHPLATTYGAVDATLPKLQWDMLAEGLRFYFVEKQSAGAMVTVAAAFLTAVPLLQRWSRAEAFSGEVDTGSPKENATNQGSRASSRFDRSGNRSGTGQAVAMGAVSLAFTLVYMLLHDPRITYYLFPASAYAMAVAVLCLIRAESARPGDAPSPLVRRAALAAPLAAAVALMPLLTMPVSPDFTRPRVAAAFVPRAIVWADLLTGPVNYFLHRQAAVLPFLDASLWRPLMEAIERDGVPQFLVVDSPNMGLAADEIGRRARLRPAGQAFTRDVFRLELAPAPSPETRSGTPPETRSETR